MNQEVYLITPVAKPRATRRDKWNPSKAVLKYRAFADSCRFYKVQVPVSYAKFIFIVPMPKSWSIKKCLKMDGTPHMQTPDLDNFCKALFDAMLPDNDSMIWNFQAEKRWGKHGTIIVEHSTFKENAF